MNAGSVGVAAAPTNEGREPTGDARPRPCFDVHAHLRALAASTLRSRGALVMLLLTHPMSAQAARAPGSRVRDAHGMVSPNADMLKLVSAVSICDGIRRRESFRRGRLPG